jgi:hypothetical protein
MTYLQGAAVKGQVVQMNSSYETMLQGPKAVQHFVSPCVHNRFIIGFVQAKCRVILIYKNVAGSYNSITLFNASIPYPGFAMEKSK